MTVLLRTSCGAIRAYVQGEKLPPLAFLMETADELSVRPEWLILGEGEMTGVEEELAEGGVDHLLSAHSELAEWPPRSREIFVELLGSYILQAPDHGQVVQSDLGTELWAELEGDLIFLSTLPLWCWGFREMEDLSQRERFTYLLNALSALLVTVRGAGQDHSLKDYPESLLPTLRRAAGAPVELSERARKRAERLEAMLGADRSGG